MAIGEGKQVWLVCDWVEDYYGEPITDISEHFTADGDVLCTEFGTKVCDDSFNIIKHKKIRCEIHSNCKRRLCMAFKIGIYMF